MSILSGLFGGGKNPADAAMPYLNQIPGLGHDTYDSYIQQGKEAGGRTGGQYESLMNDPQAFINHLMSGYKPSEGYGVQKDELTRELQGNANAGGIAGTAYSGEQLGKGIQGLLSKDQQQYFQNVLGAYNTGLQGEQGIANQGYQASGSLADLLGNNLAAKGGLAFQGQAQQNSNQNQLMQLLGQALGGLGGFAGQKSASLFGKSLWG